MDAIIEGSASSAFEALAPFYDSYTDGYEYEAWMANVEAVALRHGLRGKRLLDIGCGTGKSFMPLLWRGYEVTACDVSPSMVDRARRLSRGTGARLIVADARELPRFGIFDLVTSMD